MNFPSIDIQGSILSADLLGKIRAEQATFQQGKDFNPAFNNPKLKDEISLAWQDAKGQWTIFQNKLKRVKLADTAATETRSFWILPLLSNLGYDFQYLKAAEEINGKSFWINNRDNNIAGFPLFIAGYNESLDKRPENKTLRISPHALVQEYLNYSEHLYGIVTNGKQIRLLRDASRLTRLSYVEFNLEKIMEEDLYSDFVILYRLLHVSRMPQKHDSGAESIIEKYHQEGLEAGATIRDKLGAAVKETIKTLANGFVNHPDNVSLRSAIANGTLNPDEYYRQQLRIIYRLLFLFVIEERNLVYTESKEAQTKRFNQIYFKHYSLLRLRKLAKRLPPPEAARHHDLWMSLVNTFALFENKSIGEKMGIMSLQGDLFSYNAIATGNYDLHQCRLNNAVLMQVVKALGYFETDKKVLIAVNYGGLDVEEFGSVYEGLLELKLKIEPIPGSDTYSCSFGDSTERSSSGSHYTPEELVQPLIKHSLDYIIEERKKSSDPEKALLEIKVCDVACGSGHILLSAARRIAHEVACIRETKASNSKEKIEQPSPYYVRRAMRDVIRNCIYGVDKNPLAVELCKVAFWLESHNPGEPLNFLDHHIKCGDAIVGLAYREELENGIADEAFKTLPGDEKEIASAFAKLNKQERKKIESKGAGIQLTTKEELINTVQESLVEYKIFNDLPERTPEEITTKQQAYKRFLDGKGFSFLKTMADSQVAQFFIPKTTANKDKLITDNEYRQILAGHKGWQGQKTAMATVIAQEKRIFHWFLEFPEVFQQQGFDCILGNPPFLGGKKISGHFGNDYLSFIKRYYEPVDGGVDFVAYFFRRIFEILKNNGFQSLISTNTISQGDTREGGLSVIKNKGGNIIYCDKNVKWPGLATVEVSLISIFKGEWSGKYLLDKKQVETITSYFDDNRTLSEPYSLLSNQNKSFQGSIILGQGFVLTQQEATEIISKEQKYSQVIFPYISGDDFSNNPEQSASRYVINFFDWELEHCKQEFPFCFDIVEKLVKPEREKVKRDTYRNNWWVYAEKGINLYKAIKEKKQILVVPLVSKYTAIGFVPAGSVYSNKLGIFTLDSFDDFCLLQSTLHNIWSWKFASTLGSGTLNYSNTICFETFPFPNELSQETKKALEQVGEQYYGHRKQLMLLMQLGLTKTYNLFHSQFLTSTDIEKQSKQDRVISERAFDDIIKLRELHKQMDETVLKAYGWNDIKFLHDFYEVDYLPENDRIRYTIHPDARKEILKRLLELNHTIYEGEIKEGLHNKEVVEVFYKQKGESIPAEILLLLDKNKKEKIPKEKKKTPISIERESIYKQPGLFEISSLFNNENYMKKFSLNEGIYSIKDTAEITQLTDSKVRRWFNELSKEKYEGFSTQERTDIDNLRISFHGLIEMVVIGTLRDNGFGLKKILKARKDLSAKTGKVYPFATNNVKDKLHVAGSDIVFEFSDGSKVTLDGKGQINIDFITLFFKDIEFNVDGIAQRLFPARGKGKIVVDPNEGGGKPAIIGKEVWVDLINNIYTGPASIKMIQDQYNLDKDEVLAAVEFSK
ncbi:MAG: N-6 DNA methylase [Bacteroidia bacterium]|nr:N-6 DNA methylase [Bacteroidia bacterium]